MGLIKRILLRKLLHLLCDFLLLFLQLGHALAEFEEKLVGLLQLILVHHSDILGMSPLCRPPLNQILLVLVYVGAILGNLLQVRSHLLLPRLLRLKILLLGFSQQFRSGDIQVREYLPERWPISGLTFPTELNQQLKSLRTGARDQQLERVVAHTPDYG